MAFLLLLHVLRWCKQSISSIQLLLTITTFALNRSRKMSNNVKLSLIKEWDLNGVNLTISGSVTAGFPSPANDYIEDELSLKALLVQNKDATFFFRVTGNSLVDANIHDGDILVVDKSLSPKKDSILICFINGEFTAKKVGKIGNDFYLIPANNEFKPIKIDEEANFKVWAVVTYVIHKV